MKGENVGVVEGASASLQLSLNSSFLSSVRVYGVHALRMGENVGVVEGGICSLLR